MAGNESHGNASHGIRCASRSPKRSILCRAGGILPLSNHPRQFGSSPEGRQRQNVRAGAASGAAANFPQQGSPDTPGSPLISKDEEDDHLALHAIDIGASGASKPLKP